MQNKIELVDQDSYYRAFKQWLDQSISFFNERDENQMNEYWLKFADDLGIRLGISKNEKITAEIFDRTCWKQAKKYYSIISYEANVEIEPATV